jgi:hypothetical protein
MASEKSLVISVTFGILSVAGAGFNALYGLPPQEARRSADSRTEKSHASAASLFVECRV